MDRKEFIRTGSTYCLGALLLGITLTEMTSCANLPVYKTQLTSTIAVPLSSFGQGNVVIVRPADSEYDILLIKKNVSEYTALLMKCTHRANPLTATKDGLYCPAHGSRFDLNGNVTEPPAAEPLKHYKTSIDKSSVIINTNA